MSDPDALRRLAASVGRLLAALGVFLCAWLTFRTDDWRQWVLYSALALGSAAAGAAFTRLAAPRKP